MSPQTFIFDFDSTIFPGETLDEIIQLSLTGTENAEEKKALITSICNQGMLGEISMEDSLKKRLEIAAPLQETIEKYVAENKKRIDENIKTLLTNLQKKGHAVYVISGGFEEWIQPLLEEVVPAENIHANQIKDTEQPMIFENIVRRSKEEILQELTIQGQHITMIGDGATDFSVFENGFAQQFVGTFFYTGIEARKKIVEKALDSNQVIFNELDEFVKFMDQTFMST
jgi:D-3-phosphoglycerate dehydrogenase